MRALVGQVASVVAVSCLLVVAAIGREPEAPLRIVVITGGHFHDASFYGLMDGIEGVKSAPVMSCAEAFAEDRRDEFDVAVFYDFTRDLDETGRKNLRAFVEAGKGVVVLHHALLDFEAWDWWADEVVGAQYRLAPKGKTPASSVKDGIRMAVAPTPGVSHPSLNGIEAFEVADEGYRDLDRVAHLQPLLVLTAPVDGSDDVVAWVGPSRTSRVVATSLGHGPECYKHPAYRQFVHNAIRWAGRRLD
jgi:type 1 glutamine amidotransferase